MHFYEYSSEKPQNTQEKEEPVPKKETSSPKTTSINPQAIPNKITLQPQQKPVEEAKVDPKPAQYRKINIDELIDVEGNSIDEMLKNPIKKKSVATAWGNVPIQESVSFEKVSAEQEKEDKEKKELEVYLSLIKEQEDIEKAIEESKRDCYPKCKKQCTQYTQHPRKKQQIKYVKKEHKGTL